MKQIKTIYLLAAILVGSLAACTKADNTEVTLYDDAAVVSFTLGTVNRYVDGVKSAVAGSNYTFHIDQINRTIYNTDSLPLGTDVSRVVCTLTTYANSSPYLVDEDETMMTYYNGTDSIDFTNPRKFRIVSSSGMGYTDYTVKVNVHKSDPDAFTWKKMADLPVMTGLRSLTFDNRLYVFGNEGGTTKAYYTTDGTSWTAAELPALTQAGAWQSAVASNDSLYLLDGTSIYRSDDARTWVKENNVLPESITLQRLLGASTAEVYALATNGSLLTKYCDDEFPLWVQATDETNYSFDEQPTQDFAMISYPMAWSDSTDCVLLAGNKKVGDTWKSRVWRRAVDYSDTGIVSLLIEYLEALDLEAANAPEWIRKWTYMDRADNTRYEMPVLENLQMVWYDGVLLAFGGKSLNDTSVEPLATVYKSRDNGITWIPEKNFSVTPVDGDSRYNGEATGFSASVCNGSIWIVFAGTGEVWRGHINRLAWDD
jgi:hypothetical protein